jgi:hypothetical protein
MEIYNYTDYNYCEHYSTRSSLDPEDEVGGTCGTNGGEEERV